MKAKWILVLTAFVAGASSTAGSNLCQLLAKQAERVPAADWLASAQDPMDKLLNVGAMERSRRALTLVEKQLLKDLDLREELSVGPEDPLDIERLEGSDVYRIDSFQGTATCQSMVFVEAPHGKARRRLPAPFEAQPCTTQRGRFGHAHGKSLFIVGGRVAMDELARTYKISAWQRRNKAWTPTCELRLEFDSALKLTGSYCSSDTALCKAAAGLAPSIAEAYARDASLDPLNFADRREPPKSLQELLGGELTTKLELPAELPTFGAKTEGTSNPFLTSFSYAPEPVRLALWLDGRWWLGVVGVAGIGWRSSTTSLLAVYAISETGLVPAAGFQVEKQLVGSARAHWQPRDQAPSRR